MPGVFEGLFLSTELLPPGGKNAAVVIHHHCEKASCCHHGKQSLYNWSRLAQSLASELGQGRRLLPLRPEAVHPPALAFRRPQMRTRRLEDRTLPVRQIGIALVVVLGVVLAGPGCTVRAVLVEERAAR